ncbi:hypothetical protein CFC21_098750 [Triticum aestivum]|uniref:MADS-box domain-containing protein n=2 Tax=Triticum aestivum TaxID=4565 RepID=A0A3B6RJ45_WHEAT|nr:uncharacterized protein LOC123154738 [Triticum aestivum]KAF7096861.1 hypothetical protein CFC21_098750 [Triticum aestivum]
MARPMRLMENARERAKAHANRANALKKQAEKLATLCAVPVALVCTGAGAPPLVWESEEGVLERYRRAVPPEARAGHTHRDYLEAELGKRRAKLARARHGCPAALPDWDEALNDMTLDDARALLRAIDAALRATGDRMEALGVPADHGHGPLGEQVAPDSSDVAVMPQHFWHDGGVSWTVGDPVDMADAEGLQQLQMVPYHGGNNDDLLEQFPRDHGFQMQPGCNGFQCAGGNFSGDGDDGMLALGLGNAGYNHSGCGDGMLAPGFANAGYNYSVGGGDKMLAPGFGNAGYNWPDLTMWHTDEVCFADGTLAPEHYSGEVAAGGDYVSTLPSGYGYPMAMGMDVGDNFTSLESNYTAAHWQAKALHRSNANASASTMSGSALIIPCFQHARSVLVRRSSI